VPQLVGTAIGLVLALLFLILLIFKKWVIGTIQIKGIANGKPHHGVHHKAVEQGDVCAKMGVHIPANVVMVH
jgi:hypothetical protein